MIRSYLGTPIDDQTMNYKATIEVRLRPSILDPQGKATQHALHSLSYTSVERVRMGKLVELWLEAPSEEEARATVRETCEKLLANPVMEDFSIEIEKAEAVTA